MPAYFRFLTVMAFYVFIQEKVNVAIVEVGIGGLYDCTNVIRYYLNEKIWWRLIITSFSSIKQKTNCCWHNITWFGSC